eukprot:g3267.t1
MGLCASSEAPAVAKQQDGGGNLSPDQNKPQKLTDRQQSKSFAELKVEAKMASKKRTQGAVFSEAISLSDEAYSKLKVTEKKPAVRELIMKSLEDHFVFSGLDQEERDAVVGLVQPRDIIVGDALITEGDVAANEFYIIESGTVDIDVGGKFIRNMGAGSSLGELALLYNSPRTASARCKESGRVWVLGRKPFRYIVTKTSSANYEATVDALANVDLIQFLTDEQLHDLAAVATEHNFHDGDLIIEKGSEGDVFFLLLDGKVRCSEVGKDGLGSLEIVSGGEHSYFGERALITNEPRAANVTAVGDVRCMTIDRDTFVRLLGPLQDAMDQNLTSRILKTVPLLTGLTEEEHDQLNAALGRQQFAKGTRIITQGELGESFFIIRDGEVEVLQKMEKSPGGKVRQSLAMNRIEDLLAAGEVKKKAASSGIKQAAKEQVVARLGHGQYFGELALLNDTPRNSTIRAAGDVECFVISRDAFNGCLGSLSDIMAREAKRIAAIKMTQEKPGSFMMSGVVRTTTWEDVEITRLLGTGTFGRVRLGKDRLNGKLYAVKTMQKAQIVEHTMTTAVVNEKTILSGCNHPFIIKLICTHSDRDCLYMVMEFVLGGELYRYMQTNAEFGLPLQDAQFYSASILDAFDYLHKRHIAYRDIKPENVLIDEDGYIKLIDFGFAKKVVGLTHTLRGTPEYLAPELLQSRPHGRPVDIWGLGVLTYELLFGHTPFVDPDDQDNPMLIYQRILSGRPVEFPEGTSEKITSLIKQLLHLDPRKRL